ncbi:MAG: hypothetical protein ABI867_12030 [Kofleriaceae bacterium]
MGYAYSVYAVDLAKLTKLWGSSDTRLAARLAKAHADEYASKDEWFEGDIAKGAPAFATAVTEVLAGRPTQKKHGFIYGYAVELLCQHLGSRVDEVSLTWFDKALDPFLKKAKQPKLAKLLGAGILPVPIPKPKDFPEIGTIDAKAGAALVAAMDAIAPLAPPPDDFCNAGAVIVEVRAWVTRAAKRKRQLVWFLY